MAESRNVYHPDSTIYGAVLEQQGSSGETVTRFSSYGSHQSLITYPWGAQEQFQMSSRDATVQWQKDGNGFQTGYRYDGYGFQNQKTDPLGG